MLDQTVARLNIEHFRRLLEREADTARRETLLRLLAEEEVKLEKAARAERRRLDT